MKHVTKHVALLRGINVGGKNILPMKDLAAMFEAAGCADVRTYIQSGNVVFSAPAGVLRKLPEQVAKAIEKRFGFMSPVILRSSEDLARAIRENPFLNTGAKGTGAKGTSAKGTSAKETSAKETSAKETSVDEKWLHVYFLAALPETPAVASLDPNRSTPDVFHVREREIYLHLPNGMGRSKLTNAYFDSKLKTISTARNWATICKLLAMMEE
jgi:uncharacterized protein (DUF1697 family)